MVADNGKNGSYGPGGNNGKKQHPQNGGQGEHVFDPHHLRQDIRMAVRAVVSGLVDRTKAERIVEALNRVIETAEDPRAVVAAAKGSIEILKLGQQVAEFDDRTDRLDAGQSTENITHFQVVIPEARERV